MFEVGYNILTEEYKAFLTAGISREQCGTINNVQEKHQALCIPIHIQNMFIGPNTNLADQLGHP